MEQLTSENIPRHVKDRKVIGSNQYAVITGRSCLTNMITFYDEIVGLAEKGRAVDTVYLEFSKAFVTVSHIIL